MAFFDFTRRRTDIDDAMRSTDSTLNVFVLVLLVAAALGTWYFYWQTPNDIGRGPDHHNSRYRSTST